MKHYVIIGGGVAGTTAAETIRSHDSQSEITIISGESYPFYYRPMLSDYFGGSIAKERLIARRTEDYASKKIRLLTGVSAVSTDATEQRIALNSGDMIGYDVLLIATGRKPARAEWDPGKIKGIFYLSSLDDAEAISSSIQRINKAVVVGCNLFALEALRGLRARHISCISLCEEDRFWPSILDAQAAGIIERCLSNEHIDVKKGLGIREILLANGQVHGVVTTQDETIDCDAVIACTMPIPNVEFLGENGLPITDGIPVDEELRTSLPNILAAGDVARVAEVSSGNSRVTPGWLPAWQQGGIAGANMAGEHQVYKGLTSIGARVFTYDLVALGTTVSAEGGYREITGDYPHPDLPYVYKKLVLRDDIVVGAFFVGDASEAGIVDGWIRNRIPKKERQKKIVRQMFDTHVWWPAATLSALCPVCKFGIQVGEDAQDGDIVTCPACGVEFRLVHMPNGFFRAEHV